MLPDVIDSACEQEQMATEQAIAMQRYKSQPEQYQNPDGSWPQAECADCGGEIEEGRLEMGKVRCFLCQSDKEARAHRGLR